LARKNTEYYRRLLMILTSIKKDDEMALNINNDIYRLVKGLN